MSQETARRDLLGHHPSPCRITWPITMPFELSPTSDSRKRFRFIKTRMETNKMKKFIATSGAMAALAISFASPSVALDTRPPDVIKTEAIVRKIAGDALAKARGGLAPSARTAPTVSSIVDYRVSVTTQPIGWHFAHFSNCYWFGAANGDQMFVGYGPERESIWSINDQAASDTIALACNGDAFWWNIVDPSGEFNEFETTLKP
jgi:hypothetical protein